MDNAHSILQVDPWSRQLVSRERVQKVLSDASVEGRYRRAYEICPEAGDLTLANIISSAVRRQRNSLRARRRVTDQEYLEVRIKAREMSDLLITLQCTDDPPPTIDLDELGHSVWDDWASARGLVEARGAKPSIDKKALSNLIAFFELAIGDGKNSASADNSPMRLFLSKSFDCAKEVFWSDIQESSARKAYMLGEPSKIVVEKLRARKAEMDAARRRVDKAFVTWRQEVEPAFSGSAEKA